MLRSNLQKRFGVAYGRLCHFVALRRDATSIVAAEDGVVRATLYFCESATAIDLEELAENAKAFFSLSFTTDEIGRSIERLVQAGQVERVAKGARLLPHTLAEVEASVRSAQDTEQVVREEWAATLLDTGLIEARDRDDAWKALQGYLAALFTRHGVQTLELLSPEFVADESIDMPASDILDEIVHTTLPRLSRNRGRRIIRSFLTERTPRRDSYLTELLDGTFSFFALTVDEQTRELIRKNLPPLKLLVDTNFLFGLLDLHSNDFVAISKDVVAVIREQQLPFQLYYHPLTVEEFRSVLSFYRRLLAGGQWPSAVSRALLKVGDVSGLERRFHEVNAEQSTLVEDFFTRYGNLERVLESYGIKPYRNEYERWLEDDETLNLISKYKRFIEPKEKVFTVLRHDIVLWRTLREMSQHGQGPFGSGAFFLTCDYSLWRFDHQQLNRGTTGVTVLPSVFMQLLRPFIPRTPNFDASFVGTFALPEFRTIRSATAKAVSRVASVIRLYSDLPEDLAEKILSDEMLIRKVTKVDEDDPVVVALIESAIADEAKRLKHERDRLRDELDRQSKTAARIEESLREASATADNRLAAIERLQANLDLTHEKAEEALRAASSHSATAAAQISDHQAKAAHLQRERDEAKEDARRVSSDRDAEKARATKLERRLAATMHFVVAVIVAIATVVFFGSNTIRGSVLASSSYAAVTMLLELVGWGGKQDQPWWGRTTAFFTYALGLSAFLVGDANPTAVKTLAAASLGTFLVLVRDVMPKRKL